MYGLPREERNARSPGERHAEVENQVTPSAADCGTAAGDSYLGARTGSSEAERGTRVGQGHVERLDLRDPDVGEDLPFISPVDLGL